MPYNISPHWTGSSQVNSACSEVGGMTLASSAGTGLHSVCAATGLWDPPAWLPPGPGHGLGQVTQRVQALVLASVVSGLLCGLRMIIQTKYKYLVRM